MVKTTTRILKAVGCGYQTRGYVVVYGPLVVTNTVKIYVLMVIVILLRVVPLARANIDVRQMRNGGDVREDHAMRMQVANYCQYSFNEIKFTLRNNTRID